MIRIICILIGYVFGLFQTSYIIGKMHGIDIRDYGSGNAGMTNAMRTLGTKAGIITFLVDCLKCILAVVTVHLLFGREYSGMIRLLGLYASAGTILGHNFPFYLGFRGGKGIAATAGMVIAFDLRITAIEILIFAAIVICTHYVSLGSLVVYVVLITCTVIFGQTGLIHIDHAYLPEMYLLIVALSVLAFWQHRKNIRKLLTGTERKTYLSSRKKRREEEREQSEEEHR